MKLVRGFMILGTQLIVAGAVAWFVARMFGHV